MNSSNSLCLKLDFPLDQRNAVRIYKIYPKETNEEAKRNENTFSLSDVDVQAFLNIELKFLINNF